MVAFDPSDEATSVVPDAVVVNARASVQQRQQVVGRFPAAREIVFDDDEGHVLRELTRQRAEPSPAIVLTGCRIDLRTRTVFRLTEPLTLTEKEASLFQWLLSKDGAVVSRGELLQNVWGYRPEMVTRVVDVTVARLREKIERDPSEPEHLLTVRGEGYRLVGPQRPSQTSSNADVLQGLFGRVDDFDRLLGEVAPGRVVSVVGPGGVGKTTLARALCRQRGAVWVDLISVQPAGVQAAVAQALELATPDTSLQTLAEALVRRTPSLMVLDNAEHLGDALTRLVEGLLEHAPQCSLVTTSRTQLRTSVERVVRLEPLAAEPGRALFLALARAQVESYDAPPEVVDAIVQRVGGLPLAIELAASRARLLPAEQLLQRLSDPQGWLQSTQTGSRQASLRELVQWSWDLLTADEQQALARISVFPSSAPLDGIEAVVGGDVGAASAWIDGLLDSGLLTARDGRIEAPVGVRDFAADALAASGERAHTEERLAQWCGAKARDLTARLHSAESQGVFPQLRRERTTLVHALQLGEACAAVSGDIACGLVILWGRNGAPRQELQAAWRCLDTTTDPSQRARLLRALCWGWSEAAGIDPVDQLADELRALAQQLSPADAAHAWVGVSWAAAGATDIDAARAALTTALEVAPPGSDMEVIATLSMARLEFGAGNVEEARPLAERALTLARRLDTGLLVAWASSVKAMLLSHLGRTEATLAMCRQMAEIYRANGLDSGLATVDGMIGRALVTTQRVEEGLTHLDRYVRYTAIHAPRSAVEAEALRTRALGRRHAGRFRDAVDDALRADERLAGTRQGWMAQWTLSRCWFELDALTEAEEAMQLCLQTQHRYAADAQIFGAVLALAAEDPGTGLQRLEGSDHPEAAPLRALCAWMAKAEASAGAAPPTSAPALAWHVLHTMLVGETVTDEQLAALTAQRTEQQPTDEAELALVVIQLARGDESEPAQFALGRLAQRLHRVVHAAVGRADGE